MFKADGSEVRNVTAFVAKIGSYEGGLFTADGDEIRNPSRFASLLVQQGRGSDANSTRQRSRSRSPRPVRRASMGGRQGPAPHRGDAVLYKASGEPIWNPEAFVGKITNYDGGLTTADGEEIRNPQAFLAGLSRATGRAGGRGDGGKGRAGGKGEGEGVEGILFKADGTPIRNARKFVASIDNYSGGLYSASGQEVKNPQAFVEGAERQGGAGRPAREEALAYNSNGDPIRNLSRFVENLRDYSGGLYTASGQEIRDPRAFLAGLERKAEAPGTRRGAKGSGKGSGGGKDRAPLYKADGTPIWNPEAFVAKIYDYDGGLFTSDGQEVKNPQAFVAGLAGKGRR